MKWSEIKKAVEQADVQEDDEILEIHCEIHGGDKTLSAMKLGKLLKLEENLSEEARKEADGCAC